MNGENHSVTNFDFGWDYFKAIWSTLDRFTETPTAELSMQLQIYQGAFQAEFALSVLGGYYTAGALVEVRAMYQAWAAGGSLFGVGNELVKNPGIVNGLRQVGSSGNTIIDPSKFNYLFGQVSSSAHNLQRSIQNLQQLARIGIHNTSIGRAVLQNHFQNVARSSNNILRIFSNQHGSFQIRESLLSGPGGFLKIESTWQVFKDGTLRFVTAIPFGGN